MIVDSDREGGSCFEGLATLQFRQLLSSMKTLPSEDHLTIAEEEEEGLGLLVAKEKTKLGWRKPPGKCCRSLVSFLDTNNEYRYTHTCAVHVPP